MLVSLVLAIVAVALYCWLMLPRLRRLSRWHGVIAELAAVLERACARLRGLCGNSKTIAVAYAAELLGVLDEAKVLDWSETTFLPRRWMRGSSPRMTGGMASPLSANAPARE